MKHTLAIGAVGVILIMSMASCAHQTSSAGGINSHQQLVTGETPDSVFAGTLDKIDVENQQITVQHWPLYKTFKVEPQCDISIPNKDLATLADLKVGQSVVVGYQKSGGVLEANRIARRSREYDQEKAEQYERLEEMLNPSPNQ